MPIIMTVLSLLLVTASVAYAQMSQIDRIEVVEYGIYTVDRAVQGRDALGINQAVASNVRHAATMRTIPAQIGTTFGFRYKVVGKPYDAPVDLRKVVIFPRRGLIPSASAKPVTQDEFPLHTRVGQTSYVSYTLEDSFELVPGIWVFEIWQGNRKLATQSFNVVVHPGTDCEGETCIGL
jgi:hypothetical protein